MSNGRQISFVRGLVAGIALVSIINAIHGLARVGGLIMLVLVVSAQIIGEDYEE